MAVTALPAETTITMIHPADVGECGAELLTAGGHDGEALFLTGAPVTMEEVRAELLKHPAGEWVIFNGIRNDVMVNHLTRWDLDKASPDHPIRIILDSALSVVNTRGWEKLRDKIGAIPGVIRDLESGEPNGHIRGFTNGVLQYEEMEWPEDWETRMVEEQKEVFRRLNSQGLTTVIGRAQGLSVTILQKLWRQKELTPPPH